MSVLYIVHHFGLGDHFVCSGLVRHLAEGHSKTYVYCLGTYKEAVSSLYSDTNGRIEALPLGEDWLQPVKWSKIDGLRRHHFNLHDGSKLVQIGFRPIENHSGASFDDSFYIQSKIDFNTKWNKFAVPAKYVDPYPSDKGYAFVHQDIKRGYTIDLSKITLPIVQPDFNKMPNALDYIKIIQCATEIHCIDSSFLNLIDLLNEKSVPMNHHGNLFYHWYSRQALIGAQPHLKKIWTRLDTPPSKPIVGKLAPPINILDGFQLLKKTPILNLHCAETNLGDFICSPLSYFDFPNHTSMHLDLRRLDIHDKGNGFKLGNAHLIVGGGGLIHQFHSQMEHISEKKKGVLSSWALGHNSHFAPHETEYPQWLEGYDVHGLRDYGTVYPYVPDVSCMSPLFDTRQKSLHKYGVYMHAENFINTTNSVFEDAPIMTNYHPDFEKVIRFLGSCEIILTNTYHGCYWAQLLGKKVVLYRPFSTRFYKFKHIPPSIRAFGELPKSLEGASVVPSDYLEECRELNRSHYNDILSRL